MHYILAKPLHTDVGSIGIPAFDQGKSLVSGHSSLPFSTLLLMISE